MTQREKLFEAFIAPVFRVLRGDIPEDHWGRFYEIGQAFLIIGLLTVFIILITRRFLRWQKIGQPVESAPARVLSTQTTLSHDMKGDRPLSSRVHYYATFAREDGGQAEYEINESLYKALRKGDTGRLTVKGTRLIRFEKE